MTTDAFLKQRDDERKICQRCLAVNDPENWPTLFINVAASGARADACARYPSRTAFRPWLPVGTSTADGTTAAVAAPADNFVEVLLRRPRLIRSLETLR